MGSMLQSIGRVRPRMKITEITGALAAGIRRVFVIAEPTPNPDSIMFYPSARDVLGRGTKTKQYRDKHTCTESPLASALFKVRGVNEIMLAARHVTVTKKAQMDWEVVKPNVELVMSQFFASGIQVIREEALEMMETVEGDDGSVEAQIIEILEERVQPFVQQDGGDVHFVKYDAQSGVVYLQMSGACSGCPKSSETLKGGIQQVIQHYIPEVTDIVAHEE